MHRITLSILFLALICTSAMAASSPQELKSRLAAARSEANAPTAVAPQKSAAPSVTDDMAKDMANDMVTDMPVTPLVAVPDPMGKKEALTPSSLPSKPAKVASKATPKTEAKIAPVAAALPAPKADLLALPQTMKPVETITSNAAPVNNTPQMTPAIPVARQVASVAMPIPELHRAPVTPAGFQPPAAAANGPWAARSMKAADKAGENFCLLENKFDNGINLLIGQGGDGFGTIGLNYGIDMLREGKSYQIVVQVDNSFDESFMGLAQTDRTLVIQLGKKPSFFAALRNAQAIHIVVPGAASTFAAQGLAMGMTQFSSCLTSIGGTMPEAIAPQPVINPVATMPIAPMAPVVTQDLAQDLPKPMPVQAKTPPVVVAPLSSIVADTNILPSKMPAPVVADLPPAAPVAAPMTTPVAAPMNIQTPQPMPQPKPPVLSGVTDHWLDRAHDLLTQANVKTLGVQDNGTSVAWHDAKGTLHGQGLHVPGSDMIDAATFEMDRAEKACGGEFSSQLGAPDESVKGLETMEMESKCSVKGVITVTAWLLHKDHDQITAWKLEGGRDQHDAVFKIRSQILDAVKTSSATLANAK